MDFWNKTQTSVIFSSAQFKGDYETTNTTAYGPRASGPIDVVADV